jgi:acetate kinase
MATRTTRHLLTINTGSSSLKAAVFQFEPRDALAFSMSVGGIGQPGGTLRVTDPNGAVIRQVAERSDDFQSALGSVVQWCRRERPDVRIAAVGHRIVHGGRDYRDPVLATPQVLHRLRDLVPIDPDHMPQALAAIAAVGRDYPEVPQVLCFDTAFHAAMPRVARVYALPRDLTDAGVVRYGFHGLSYESVMARLRELDPGAARGRIIIAHLGSGASVAAVRGGVGIETTMGFSPTGGLVMSTRSGDLDPSVVLYLVGGRRATVEEVRVLVNQRAGMLAVSGTTGDMKTLLEREPGDPDAAEAVALFCYQCRKFVGALAAALGGVDTLVFTGGIGEHAAPVRERICQDLAFLGIRIDAGRNAAHASVISPERDGVIVRVIPANEELMIARHTRGVVEGEGDPHVSV